MSIVVTKEGEEVDLGYGYTFFVFHIEKGVGVPQMGTRQPLFSMYYAC